MRTRRQWILAASISGVIACGSGDSTSNPGFSINGGSCSTPKNVTLEEQAGATMADKTLSLTFDDGPSEATAELSRFLKKEGIAATFFINGANAEGREGILEQQVEDGHLLANHTHTHPSLPELEAKAVVDEVEATDQVLSGRVPNGKLYFRPPFGNWSESVMKAISASTMQKYIGPVFWDIGDHQSETTAADWDCWEDNGNGTQTVRACGDLYIKEIHAKKKGIVLMHDGPPGAGREQTVAMIKYMVPLLKAEGYKFARLDDVPLTKATAGVGPAAEPPGSGAGGKGSLPVGADPCK